MIEELQIKNLGVIESAQLQFGPGLNALTGETGAGKTMALTSLMMLMGAKIDTAKVRAGADAASVDGTFVVAANSPAVDIVRQAGGEVDIDGDQAVIYVSRQVPAVGRSRAFAGGRSVPLATLRDLCEHVVTVHGQSDQLRLKAPRAQRQALDSFGGDELAQALNTYKKQWEIYTQLQAKRAQFAAHVAQAGTERLALEALVSRVDAVNPVLGEEAELKTQAMMLESVEDVRAALVVARGALDSDDVGALAQLDLAASALAKIADKNSDIAAMVNVLRDASARASDVVNDVGAQLAHLEADPDRLNSIHERRAQLRALERDLGMPMVEIIERRRRADEQLATLADPQQTLADIDQQVSASYQQLLSCGAALHDLRVKFAKRISKLVTQELMALAMKDATFSVAVTKLNEPQSSGIDAVEFQLSPYRDSALLPLGQTASGGEMSRVMLALEAVLAADTMASDHTFIFDEVDAGIGGKTALTVGERLGLLGRSSQVIAVTHLAQVAAYATRHITVSKDSTNKQTRTEVRVLSSEERAGELARMLSGHEESEAALAHAAELLSSAHVS